jgi:hypothetical protein
MRFAGLALTVSSLATAAGFHPIFDGKTLTGWTLVDKDKPGNGYIVENGAIVCPTTGGGNLLTERDYANFVFRFEFKMEPGGNNGIGIRAPLAGDIAYSGMEIQSSITTTKNIRANSSPRSTTAQFMTSSAPRPARSSRPASGTKKRSWPTAAILK